MCDAFDVIALDDEGGSGDDDFCDGARSAVFVDRVAASNRCIEFLTDGR